MFTEPPAVAVAPSPWASRLEDGRVQCELCPRYCRLKEEQRGFCFVRRREGDSIILDSYGRASGFCIDPIEKKPLYHFFPGSSVLSFGTAGCNLGCRFCQNWDISKAREMDRLMDTAGPLAISRAAAEQGCRSIAFTYNDPVIFAEYAIDCAHAAKELGLKSVAVTAGYITEAAREAFFAPLDAVNVDLKAFSDEFYRRQCYGQLEPVLDTLRWIAEQPSLWLEVTTLLIPGLNDSEAEVDKLCNWFLEHLGSLVPLHFTAFHPDFKLGDIAPTPASTLLRAREQALRAGLRHVYTGNISSSSSQTTRCTGCGADVITRDGYWILDTRYRCGSSEQAACAACGEALAGCFDAAAGRWGSRRKRLTIVEAT